MGRKKRVGSGGSQKGGAWKKAIACEFQGRKWGKKDTDPLGKVWRRFEKRKKAPDDRTREGFRRDQKDLPTGFTRQKKPLSPGGGELHQRPPCGKSKDRTIEKGVTLNSSKKKGRNFRVQRRGGRSEKTSKNETPLLVTGEGREGRPKGK